MAAPFKSGLPYFHYEINSDPKIRYLVAKHGLVGKAVFFEILKEIYSESYYLKWGEKEKIFFCNESKLSINTFDDILKDIFNENLLNLECYEKYSIFTSHGIQRRYATVCERRSVIFFIKEYTLLTSDEINLYKNITIISVNAGKEISTEDFNRLWDSYPRQEGRNLAITYFLDSVKTKKDLNDIEESIKNYILSIEGREFKYIKKGSTFFQEWRTFISPKVKEKESVKYKSASEIGIND